MSSDFIKVDNRYDGGYTIVNINSIDVMHKFVGVDDHIEYYIKTIGGQCIVCTEDAYNNVEQLLLKGHRLLG